VQALAPGSLEKRLEAQVIELLAERQRSFDDPRPRQAFVGIEIERKLVRIVELARVRSPGVNLERADLHERHQAARVADHHVLRGRAVVLHERHAQDVGRHAARRVLLMKAIFARAFRAAHQHQWTLGDVRQHPLRDLGVIVGEFRLGDA
jgi:hypothetical protein